MPKPPRATGVSILMGVAAGHVEKLRREARGTGEDRYVFADLDLKQLNPIYRRLEEEYGVALDAARDLEPLRFALQRAAGGFRQQFGPDTKPTLAGLRKLQASIGEVVELCRVGQGGIHDERHIRQAQLIAEQLSTLPGVGGIGKAWPDMVRIGRQVEVLEKATASAVETAEAEVALGGRPPQTWIHHLCLDVDAILRASGTNIGVSGDDSRPGILVDLLVALDGFMPLGMKSSSVSTWRQRVKRAREWRGRSVKVSKPRRHRS